MDLNLPTAEPLETEDFSVADNFFFHAGHWNIDPRDSISSEV
jgi:hypothetical protein